MDLIRVSIAVEYSFSRVYGVGYDNNFGGIINGTCLIDTVSNSKEFSFRTCDEGSVMNCFDHWSIERMDVRYRGGNIFLDASVSNYKSGVRIRRTTKSHFI